MVREQTRRFAVACLAAAVVVLVDQATKAAALGGLSQEERIPLLGDLLGLQLAFNPGTVMSFGADATWVLTVVATAAPRDEVAARRGARVLVLEAGQRVAAGCAVSRCILGGLPNSTSIGRSIGQSASVLALSP